MSFKQAERRGEDGPVHVTRAGDGFLIAGVTSNGKEETILMSDHNAARLAVTLAFMLGVKKFGDLGKVRM